MAETKHRMANKLPRKADARALETIEKEFERLYRIINSLIEQSNETAEVIESGVAPSDAGYLLDAIDPDLPNARVALDGTTVDVDLTVAGQVKWELAQIAALSVLGRATNTAGVPAAIVAAAASTVLRRNAVNALEFAKVDFVDMASMAANRLLGRGSASGSGVPEVITVEDGLQLDGTALKTEYAYYEPLSDGDPDQPELIFDGAGEVIMIPVPH